MSGNKDVSLPPLIIPGNLIPTVIDNFDHEEGTPLRISGSQNTIIVVFQEKHQEKVIVKIRL